MFSLGRYFVPRLIFLGKAISLLILQGTVRHSTWVGLALQGLKNVPGTNTLAYFAGDLRFVQTRHMEAIFYVKYFSLNLSEQPLSDTTTNSITTRQHSNSDMTPGL